MPVSIQGTDVPTEVEEATENFDAEVVGHWIGTNWWRLSSGVDVRVFETSSDDGPAVQNVRTPEDADNARSRAETNVSFARMLNGE